MMDNKNKPLVTIAMPTYNRASTYLRNALQCAVNQTYDNIEIIVSDNCSSDNTEEVVHSFNDQRIRYFRQRENIGAVPNSNFCLEQSKGSYFLQLHDDDMIDDDFIETCMQAADYSTDIGIIRTGTRVIDSHGKVIQETPNIAKGLSTKEFFRCWFACKISIYLCGTIFNTNGLKEIGGFKSKHYLADDGIAIAKLANIYDRLDVKDVKASFRKHSEEITFAVPVIQWCEDFIELLDLILEVTDGDEQLRSEGIRFFCGLSYNRCKAIKSPIKRLMTYIRVYKMFQYKYSPMSHLVYPEISFIIRKYKNRARRVIGIIE